MNFVAFLTCFTCDKLATLAFRREATFADCFVRLSFRMFIVRKPVYMVISLGTHNFSAYLLLSYFPSHDLVKPCRIKDEASNAVQQSIFHKWSGTVSIIEFSTKEIQTYAHFFKLLNNGIYVFVINILGLKFSTAFSSGLTHFQSQNGGFLPFLAQN